MKAPSRQGAAGRRNRSGAGVRCPRYVITEGVVFDDGVLWVFDKGQSFGVRVGKMPGMSGPVLMTPRSGVC